MICLRVCNDSFIYPERITGSIWIIGISKKSGTEITRTPVLALRKCLKGNEYLITSIVFSFPTRNTGDDVSAG